MTEIFKEIIPPDNNETSLKRWRLYISLGLMVSILSNVMLYGFITGALPNWMGFLSKQEFEDTKYEVRTVYSFYLETRINIARQLQCQTLQSGSAQNNINAYQALQRWVNEFYRHEGYAYTVPTCAELLGDSAVLIPIVPVPNPNPRYALPPPVPQK